MTTAPAVPPLSVSVSEPRPAVPAVAGAVSAAAFVGAAVLFADALAGSSSAAEAAAALGASGGRTTAAVMLLTLSGLLACLVVAALAERTAAPSTPAARLLLPFGVLHFVLAAMAFWPLAGALSVGQNLFDAEVSAVAAEQALVSLNSLQPLAGMVGAGFLLCVFFACRAAVPSWLRVAAGIMGVAMLLPPIGWAVTYLLPLWIAAAGIALWRRPATG